MPGSAKEHIRVYAALLRGRYPDRTARELLEPLTEELWKRGFGGVTREEALAALEAAGAPRAGRTEPGPSAGTRAPGRTDGGLDNLLLTLEGRARDRMRKGEEAPASGQEKPKQLSGMEELLARLERDARNRLGKK